MKPLVSLTSLLKSLFSLDLSFEISIFSLMRISLYFSLKPLLSLCFWGSLPACATFSMTLWKAIMPRFPQCNYAPHARLRPICTSITLWKAITPCFPQCNYAHKNIKEKLRPACHAARRRNRAARAPHTASHTTSFRAPVQSDLL